MLLVSADMLTRDDWNRFLSVANSDLLRTFHKQLAEQFAAHPLHTYRRSGSTEQKSQRGF